MTSGGITNVQGKDVLGIGGAINSHHEGPVKRPTEQAIIIGDETGYKRRRPIGEAPPMNNPSFGMSPSEKKA